MPGISLYILLVLKVLGELLQKQSLAGEQPPSGNQPEQRKPDSPDNFFDPE